MAKHITLLRWFLRKLVNAFLQGLLLIAPISITLYVIYVLFEFFDNLIPLNIPGLGTLIIIGSITLIGFLGTYLIRTPISYLFNELMNRIPLIRILYSSVSDLMSAFVGQKKKFTEPVMVIMNKESDIRKLGFVTETDLHNIGIEGDYVAVYLPHSYNFSGNLFIVPTQNVIRIQAPSSDFMKFIVSGGVTKVYTPGEQEDPPSN